MHKPSMARGAAAAVVHANATKNGFRLFYCKRFGGPGRVRIDQIVTFGVKSTRLSKLWNDCGRIYANGTFYAIAELRTEV